MEAIRHVVTSNANQITVQIPDNFKNRALEIIVMPTEEESTTKPMLGIWPENFLQLAGAIPELLEIGSEGDFETRQSL